MLYFFVSGRVWEAQSVVFYVSGRLWEARFGVFYVSARVWEVQFSVFFTLRAGPPTQLTFVRAFILRRFLPRASYLGIVFFLRASRRIAPIGAAGACGARSTERLRRSLTARLRRDGLIPKKVHLLPCFALPLHLPGAYEASGARHGCASLTLARKTEVAQLLKHYWVLILNE